MAERLSDKEMLETLEAAKKVVFSGGWPSAKIDRCIRELRKRCKEGKK